MVDDLAGDDSAPWSVPLPLPLVLAERLGPGDEASTPEEDGWAGADIVAVIERFIGSMSAEERRGYEAMYVRGLSQREAAADLVIDCQVFRTMEARL